MTPAPRNAGAAKAGGAAQVAGAALIVLFGVWAGIHGYRLRQAAAKFPAAAGDAVRGPAAVPVAAGEASPPSPSDLTEFDAATPAPAKIPQFLPDFSLGDRTGRATPVSTWKGKSLILNFWATWCAPCRREIPLLQSLSAEWAARHVEVVGVAVDYPDKVLAYARSMNIKYPLLIGEQDALDVAAGLGVASPAFPFTVFTDRRGQVVVLYVGELHRAQADFILSVVQQLNDHSIELPEARRSIAAGLSTPPAAPG